MAGNLFFLISHRQNHFESIVLHLIFSYKTVDELFLLMETYKKNQTLLPKFKIGDTNLSNNSNLCESINAVKLYKYLFKVKTALSACLDKVFCVSRLEPPNVNTSPK